VVSDLSAYAEWNPFIPFVAGTLEVGATLEVVIAPPGSSEVTIRPRVLVATPEELRWQGKLLIPGLFDGEHFLKLIEVAPNRTRFVHGEDFTGILVKLFHKTLTNTARGFVLMNQALKKRVEDRTRGG
jgi:hypothetical protein